MEQNSEKEIVLVDKPKGITSFDVIRQLRKKLGIRKMGHAGTLDPLASGLMIIGLEKGTKKLNKYIKLDKVYKAEILLGRKTTTSDMEGDILEEKKISCGELDDEYVKSVLADIVGDIDLEVPIYSAVKVDGKRLYKYAREGIDVKPPTKTMHIYSINFNEVKSIENGCVIDIDIKVASGTYIRSIAEEIGKRLDAPSTLHELRRIKIGDFDIDDSKTLDEL